MTAAPTRADLITAILHHCWRLNYNKPSTINHL